MQKLVLIPIFVLGLYLGLPRQAWATPSTHATGTFTILSSTPTLVRTADGNATYAVVDHVVYTGDITGLPIDTYTLTVHRGGTLTGHGIETCTCTIGGRTGTYTAVFSFTGTFTQIQGHFTFLSGAGGLAGLRGEGTFQGSTTGTLSFDYHFEP